MCSGAANPVRRLAGEPAELMRLLILFCPKGAGRAGPGQWRPEQGELLDLVVHDWGPLGSACTQVQFLAPSPTSDGQGRNLMAQANFRVEF